MGWNGRRRSPVCKGPLGEPEAREGVWGVCLGAAAGDLRRRAARGPARAAEEGRKAAGVRRR